MRPPPALLRPTQFDAVLFDLDGVLTDTAMVHAACWQRMFDEYLRGRAARRKETFVPFDRDSDYKRYVDGKPRYDGVRSFLAARGIELPPGSPDDPPGSATVCGLGNRKNALVQEVLASEGVTVYDGSLRLLRQLQRLGIRMAVVSSSRNCAAVLQAAGLAGAFERRVDGEVADRLGLAGKPAPDTFLEAARQLGVEPRRAAVVEDAFSGVQAGRAGGFGLVIGVDRHGEAEALRRHGADIVVADLAELLAEEPGEEEMER